ncbi:MAG: thymidylate synthase [Nitrosopumilus sp.]
MNLKEALSATDLEMERNGERVHTERWQSWDISDKPEAEMVEVMHHSIQAPMRSEDLTYYQEQITPNLPWADDHFQERICGAPINPGIQWANWPWGKHANKHREGEMFNHNYMERYWPKYAARTQEATTTVESFNDKGIVGAFVTHRGLRHKYGDLNDVIQLLAQEPQTRQAYMPIWFPEDTGVTHSGRKPCTLGYHFIMRKGKLDIRYDIRSCDLFRHFRDDVYLTICLVKHVLDGCRKINPKVWDNITLGTYVMHITSLHMFVSDYYVKFGKQAP